VRSRYNRDLYEFRCLLKSWNERCSNYEVAYNYEVERNNQMVEAYRLLSRQHQQVAGDLTVYASKYRSLQKEVDIMQTDIFAQDAVIESYAQRLATQPVIPHMAERTNQSLVRRIEELEEEISRMKNALLNAGEMLASLEAGSR
jgi:chromosome segregation ATPase